MACAGGTVVQRQMVARQPRAHMRPSRPVAVCALGASSGASTSAPQRAPCRSSMQAAAAAAAAAAAVMLTAAPAFAADGTDVLFANKCAGCHMNGGNVLAIGATLFQADLEKNGVASPESLYKLIYSGKAKMPGFGKECAPKGACTFGPRLSDEDVNALVAYVQQRAAQEWK